LETHQELRKLSEAAIKVLQPLAPSISMDRSAQPNESALRTSA
jgi:hypothetical protein